MKSSITNILHKFSYIALGAGISATIFLVLFSGLWKYKSLDNVLKETQKADYDVAAYNCVDFSKDAITKLQAQNINSNIVVIKQDSENTNTHAVIGIWIDPQNGQFVSGAEYVGDYTELKTKLGWAK